MKKEDDIVLISTADWANPFWTNKQHVTVELARRGHRVLYIDSLGLRAPSVTASDIKRIMSRFRLGLKGPRCVQKNIWVWSPVVIPFQKFYVIRKVNQLLLKVGLWAALSVAGMRPEICWTYNPLSTKLFDLSKFKKIVYHCVDEIKAQPGMPGEALERAEQQLVKQADICFVTALHLLETRKKWNENTHYFCNVADFGHFSQSLDSGTIIPSDLMELPQPRIGFIGAISSYKVDFKLISELATRHPECSIVLIGKIGEGEPHTNVDVLRAHTNIHFLGPKSYTLLPAYLKGLDVAMLPSQLNDYTRSMFPMKFFEYLAAGRPVVATELHALQEYAHVALLAHDAEGFIANVEKVLKGDGPTLDSRVDVARGQTYEKRTEKMLELIYAVHAENTYV